MEGVGWHNRGYLPHFDTKGIVQHIVLCTQHALTLETIDDLASCNPNEKRARMDKALDNSSYGHVFRKQICAAALEEQLLYFDGDRYDLLAWCIMPNHVHIVCCVLGRCTLGQIVRSWKVLTTSTINRSLATKGAVFAKDYFDRFMRNGMQTQRAISYAENNPLVAGLCANAEDWRFSSAWHKSHGWQPETSNLPLSLP